MRAGAGGRLRARSAESTAQRRRRRRWRRRRRRRLLLLGGLLLGDLGAGGVLQDLGVQLACGGGAEDEEAAAAAAAAWAALRILASDVAPLHRRLEMIVAGCDLVKTRGMAGSSARRLRLRFGQGEIIVRMRLDLTATVHNGPPSHE